MTTPSPEKFFDVRITERVDFADDLWMIRVVPARVPLRARPVRHAWRRQRRGPGRARVFDRLVTA